MESHHHHHHHHHLHRKKRPRNLKLHIPISPSPSNLLLLFLIISLFLLFLIFLTRFPSGSHSFRPILTISRAHPLSIQDSSPLSLPPLKIEHQISFPDHVLLLVSKIGDQSWMNSYRIALECVHRFVDDSTRSVVLPVLSVEDYDGWRSIVRCPVSSDSSKNGKSPVFVALRQRGGSSGEEEEEGEEDGLFRRREWMHSWEDLVYNGVIDGETAVVFVKGLNLRRDRASDAAQFKCHFGWGNKFNALTTSAVTAAQEIVRCSLPRSFRNFPEKADGVGITISTVAHHGGEGEGEGEGQGLVHYVPSVARLSNLIDKRRKHELCVCTMLWNQASSLKEWIQYHAWLGVERWFIYDNNSDDGIKEVVEQLEQENYNVSRHTWPWIKTQEAGFSHCALRAKSECKWVGFIDVDEFFYFPIPSAPNRKTGEFGVYPGRNSLQSLVANVSHSPAAAGIGEIRTSCHSFGPSGLNKHPPQGVTLGYTCRLQSPERHKSIVLLDALDETLLTVVHHFHLKKGFTYINLPESTALINHYKYQVWEKFKAKFSRRVATYVADWQENQNEGSKDRAPGLGTEAIEPPNWSRQFCEVWDTGLRDFLIANLADPSSGLLPWEGHDSQ